MIDSASTDILPLFGIDELNCSLEQFWNVSSTKNIVWQYYQLVLESHYRLVNQQLTKTTNDKMTKRSYAVHFSLRTYSLVARSRGGNVEIPDMKTAYAGH